MSMKKKQWVKRALAFSMSAIILGTTTVSAQQIQSMDQVQENVEVTHVDASGRCGKKATWTFDKKSGILQIKGS
ncbi:MAG: hypothetical protein ACI4HI_08845, partial [Lachnospiraceae bacterium]